MKETELPRVSVKVTFEDGNIIHSTMNCTFEEAQQYYVGQSFNFGDTEACPQDKMVKGVKVELCS